MAAPHHAKITPPELDTRTSHIGDTRALMRERGERAERGDNRHSRSDTVTDLPQPKTTPEIAADQRAEVSTKDNTRARPDNASNRAEAEA